MSHNTTLLCNYREGCQFIDEPQISYYQMDDNFFCVFHAPLEATQLDDPTVTKRQLDVDAFNRRIIDRIKRFAADNPNYTPTYRPMSSRLGEQIAKYLQDHLAPSNTLTSLRGTVFPGAFRCKDLTIVDGDFTDCRFTGEAVFQSCVFVQRAIFRGACFEGTAWFTDSTFQEIALFTDCSFAGVKFEGAQFEREVSFQSTEFRSPVHLCAYPTQTTNQIPILNLERCTFHYFLCLRHRKIFQLRLKEAAFDEAPILTECIVGNDTVFSSAVFRDRRSESVSRYAVLYRLAISTGDLDAAERFRCLRFDCQYNDNALPSLLRGLIYVYGAGSRYGTDFTRPLVALAIVNLLSFISYCTFSYLWGGEWLSALSGADQQWLRAVVEREHNSQVGERLTEERRCLRPLPVAPIPAYTTLAARVRRWSTITVLGHIYSLPSRLIGERVTVRVYAERLEVYYREQLVERLPRLHHKGQVHIDYRHIIRTLVRKPGAFARYRWREELFPSVIFRRAYDALRSRLGERASAEYVLILHLAAKHGAATVEQVLGPLLDCGERFDAERLQNLIEPERQELPAVTITRPDLRLYDALLSAEVAP